MKIGNLYIGRHFIGGISYTIPGIGKVSFFYIKIDLWVATFYIKFADK